MSRVYISCFMTLLLAKAFSPVSTESVTEHVLSLLGSPQTELSISGDVYTGSIPTEIGNLGQLTVIKVEENDGLTGTIPTQIGVIGRLKELTIRFNDGLRGIIPTQIGKLQQLTKIDIEDNGGLAGIGSVPTQIGNLARLTFLKIGAGFNGTAIPSQIGKLERLTFLGIIREDRLTGSIPSQIGNLEELQRLVIENCDGLSGTIPTQIGNMRLLATLEVHKNSGITGTIPTEIGNTVLGALLLAENNLSGELPIELSSLTSLSIVTLSRNNFFINCEDAFLEWYIPFSVNVEDKYDFSLQCTGQVYPFHINRSSSTSLEPFESVDSISISKGSRNLTVNWTHPTISKLIVPFEFNPILRFGETLAATDDSFPTDFINCINYNEKIKRTPTTQVHERVGFELTVFKDNENGDRIRFIRNCVKEDDLEVNNVVFQYSLNFLLPATDYEIVIRAFNLQQIGQRYKFVFGPPSEPELFKTEDDIPEAAPVNLRSISATENSIDLTWDDTPELVANGEIIEYEVHSIIDGEKYPPTTLRQITITGLQSTTEYRFQVRASTRAGFSNVYSAIITTRTCPQEMKRTNENNCFAIQGSFAVSATEAFVCEVSVPDVVAGCETEEQLTVQTLDILEGFWRPNVNHFTEIQSCPVPGFCSKQRGVESVNARLLINETAVEPESKQCAQFHRGVYCSACDDGYVLSGSDGCNECTDDVKSSHEMNYALFTIFISSIVLICVGYVFFKVAGNSSMCPFIRDHGAMYTATAGAAWNRVAVKLRILEGFLQVMFAFQSVLYVDSTRSFLSEALGSIANLNLGLLAYGFEVECAVDVNHYMGLVLYTVPPLVLGLLLFSLYKVCDAYDAGWKESLIKECFNMFFIVSFLIYPGVSKVIFDTFFCEDFNTVDEDTDFIFQSALRADYRLSCSFVADGRVGWLVYAVIMVLVFPFGILVTYVYFLRSYNRIHGNYDALVKDLVHPYKENRYWFEAYELVRKLLQTAFVSFCLLFGTQVASSVALNISVTALLVLVHLNPYNNPTDFGFAIVSLASLVFATQLTEWFDTEDCDRACRTEITGDAISSLVLFEILAALLFVGLDTWRYPESDITKHVALGDQVIDQEVERLRGEIHDLKEENKSYREEMYGYKEENNSNKEEKKVLKDEIERLRSEIEGLQKTFA